jgi:hypothetical protein
VADRKLGPLWPPQPPIRRAWQRQDTQSHPVASSRTFASRDDNFLFVIHAPRTAPMSETIRPEYGQNGLGARCPLWVQERTRRVAKPSLDDTHRCLALKPSEYSNDAFKSVRLQERLRRKHHVIGHACSLGFAGALILPPFYYKNVSDEGSSPTFRRSWSRYAAKLSRFISTISRH